MTAVDPDISTSHTLALASTINRLERAWAPSRIMVDPSDQGKSNGALPYPLPAFLQAERFARGLLPPNRHNFLDVGCALGTKMLIMQYLGWTVRGIDRVPEYVEVATKLTGAQVDCGLAEIVVSDYWAQFDYIYMYRPLRDNGALSILVNKIVLASEISTVFFFPDSPAPDSSLITGASLPDGVYIRG